MYQSKVKALNLPAVPKGSAVSVDDCLKGDVAWVSNIHGLPERCARGAFLVHSGPRRMGKSTHLAMMAAYFNRNERLLQHLRDEYKYPDAQFLQEKHPVILLSLDFPVPPDLTTGSAIEADLQTKSWSRGCSRARAISRSRWSAGCLLMRRLPPSWTR